jgi:uncharacterized membrane protein
MHHTRIARRLACALTGVAATALAVAPAAAVPGTFTTIDVPGAADTIAGAVNDSGVVAGFYIDSRGTSHGFIDRHGRFTTIDVPGATGTAADSINGTGVVVGSYTDRRGVNHGFIDRHGRFIKSNDPHAGRARVAGSSTIPG